MNFSLGYWIGENPVRKTQRLLAAILATLTLCVPGVGVAATPYEQQIAGFITAVLETLITGEFAGRRPSQADAVLDRRPCTPADYDDLRAAADNTAAFDRFHQRCRLTEAKRAGDRVHVFAYLPAGYCETLKAAFEKTLEERVYKNPPEDQLVKDWVSIEYKGSKYGGTRRLVARGGKIRASCEFGGVLRISGSRTYQRP
jgi:hypothetical protein